MKKTLNIKQCVVPLKFSRLQFVTVNAFYAVYTAWQRHFGALINIRYIRQTD